MTSHNTAQAVERSLQLENLSSSSNSYSCEEDDDDADGVDGVSASRSFHVGGHSAHSLSAVGSSLSHQHQQHHLPHTRKCVGPLPGSRLHEEFLLDDLRTCDEESVADVLQTCTRGSLHREESSIHRWDGLLSSIVDQSSSHNTTHDDADVNDDDDDDDVDDNDVEVSGRPSLLRVKALAPPPPPPPLRSCSTRSKTSCVGMEAEDASAHPGCSSSSPRVDPMRESREASRHTQQHQQHAPSFVLLSPSQLWLGSDEAAFQLHRYQPHQCDLRRAVSSEKHAPSSSAPRMHLDDGRRSRMLLCPPVPSPDVDAQQRRDVLLMELSHVSEQHHATTTSAKGAFVDDADQRFRGELATSLVWSRASFSAERAGADTSPLPIHPGFGSLSLFNATNGKNKNNNTGVAESVAVELQHRPLRPPPCPSEQDEDEDASSSSPSSSTKKMSVKELRCEAITLRRKLQAAEDACRTLAQAQTKVCATLRSVLPLSVEEEEEEKDDGDDDAVASALRVAGQLSIAIQGLCDDHQRLAQELSRVKVVAAQQAAALDRAALPSCVPGPSLPLTEVHALSSNTAPMEALPPLPPPPPPAVLRRSVGSPLKPVGSVAVSSSATSRNAKRPVVEESPGKENSAPI